MSMGDGPSEYQGMGLGGKVPPAGDSGLCICFENREEGNMTLASAMSEFSVLHKYTKG